MKNYKIEIEEYPIINYNVIKAILLLLEYGQNKRSILIFL